VKQIINTIALTGYAVMFFLLFGYVVYTRLTNIDMTETRLLVTFWREYLGLIGGVSIFGLIHYLTK